MRSYRFVAILLTTAGLVLLAGAFRAPPPRPLDAPPPAPPELTGHDNANADPLATTYFLQALAAMRAPEREWLHAAVWARSRLADLPFQAEGVYYRAPGGRFRLEVKVRHEAGRQGERSVVTVDDGRTRPDGKRGKLLRGPEAMLSSLESTIAWVGAKPEGDTVSLIGVWHRGPRQSLAPADRPWPASLPRVCRLSLRGEERWPARMEWYGPTMDGGADRLLAEMEFRAPAWGRVLSEAECGRLFKVNAVEDASAAQPGEP